MPRHVERRPRPRGQPIPVREAARDVSADPATVHHACRKLGLNPTRLTRADVERIGAWLGPTSNASWLRPWQR